MQPQSIILQLASKCNQRVTLHLRRDIPLVATASTQVHSMPLLGILSTVQCSLLHLLQARATTGWLENKEDFIASIQFVRPKWGTTNFQTVFNKTKTTRSCNARSILPKSQIPLSLGQSTSPGCLLSAYCTEFFKPGRHTILKKKSANFCNHFTQKLLTVG